jgi:NAD(P)H-flavin reductase
VYLSRAKEASGYLKVGRPKYSEIFAEVAGKHMGKPILVFVCGPTPMVKDCWDTVSSRNKSGGSFIFHKEVFEF